MNQIICSKFLLLTRFTLHKILLGFLKMRQNEAKEKQTKRTTL